VDSLSDRQKKIIAVALVIHLVLLTLTWRDLGTRPEAGVRGRKRLWRVAATMNTTARSPTGCSAAAGCPRPPPTEPQDLRTSAPGPCRGNRAQHVPVAIEDEPSGPEQRLS